MKTKGLQKTDSAARIAAAMAAIRQGRGNTVERTPAPETFELHCSCGFYDKPYTLRFERQPSGLFRLKASVKGTASSPPGKGQAGGAGWTMRIDALERGPWPCAWCGNGSFHHCGDCGALVCGGRIRGGTFHCRPSCGAEWVGVPLESVTGTPVRREENPSGCMHPAPVRETRPAAAGKATLLLPRGRR